jgi:hypothetical protein
MGVTVGATEAGGRGVGEEVTAGSIVRASGVGTSGGADCEAAGLGVSPGGNGGLGDDIGGGSLGPGLAPLQAQPATTIAASPMKTRTMRISVVPPAHLGTRSGRIG